MASVNSPTIEAAVTRAIHRLDIASSLDAKTSPYWLLRYAFDNLGKQIIGEAMKAASLATTRDPSERLDADANQAQYRVVEPTLRGLLNCAEGIGGFGYEMPMKLRKSVPSPSRMKRVYYPSVKFDVSMMLDYDVRRAYNQGDATPEEIRMAHGYGNDQLVNMMVSSWNYRRAKQHAQAKKWQYILHDDLNAVEFEHWRSIARALNKNVSSMRVNSWDKSIKNKAVLAQILMGLAAQVYVYWRDLRNNVYLRE